MPDLTIKPVAAAGNKLILQDQAGDPVLTTGDSGVTAGSTILATKTGTETLTNKTLTAPTITDLSNFSGTLPPTVSGGKSPFALSAANSSTSVNAKAFTGIPSWHRHIYLFINGLSFSDSADMIMQLGYGSTTYQTSGYTSMMSNAIAQQTTLASGFGINVSSLGRYCYGMSIFTRMNDTTYYWQNFMSAHTNVPTYAAGQAILSSGPATAIQIKGSSGVQDAGTVYAGWE